MWFRDSYSSWCIRWFTTRKQPLESVLYPGMAKYQLPYGPIRPGARCQLPLSPHLPGCCTPNRILIVADTEFRCFVKVSSLWLLCLSCTKKIMIYVQVSLRPFSSRRENRRLLNLLRSAGAPVSLRGWWVTGWTADCQPPASKWPLSFR